MRQRFTLITLALLTSFTLSACASLMGNLRRDLNDDPASAPPPTIGGAWPERHYLTHPPEAMDPMQIGHMTRQPAGMAGSTPQQESWISSQQRQANLRDEYRSSFGPSDRGVSYSENPNVAPPIQRQFQQTGRVTADDFIDNRREDGSLWASNGQTNYFFTKNRVKGVGDIISVAVSDPLIKDIATEIRNTLNQNEIKEEVLRAQTRLKDKALADLKPAKGRVPAAADAGQAKDAFGNDKKGEEPEVEIREATVADIDVTPSMQIQAGEIMMGEIVERFPNGNYKVRAAKRIAYGRDMRVVTLVGVAKGTDVNDKETIEAGSLYEYMVKVFR